RIGPAHGAHKKPVATPKTREGNIPLVLPDLADSKRLPRATNGRVNRSAALSDIRAIPLAANRINANTRPSSLMRTAHAPPTAASVAIPENVTAMPASRGAVLRVNGCPARANTNGRTGRMHGLRIVNPPPRKAKI